jgi:hypothetical protein
MFSKKHPNCTNIWYKNKKWVQKGASWSKKWVQKGASWSKKWVQKGAKLMKINLSLHETIDKIIHSL